MKTRNEKLIVLYVIAAAILSFFMSSCNYAFVPEAAIAKSKVNRTANLKNILLEVQAQYDRSQILIKDDADAGLSQIELKSATVVFDAVNTLTADGNISVLVAKADIKGTLSGESTVTFDLADPNLPRAGGGKMIAMQSQAMINKKTPNYALADLIYHSAKTYVSVNDYVKLGKVKTVDFEIDLTFSVKIDGTLTVGVTSTPVGGGVSFEGTHQVGQVIKLKFGPKS